MILLLSNDPFQVPKASKKFFFVYLTVSTTLYYIYGHFFDINYARNHHRVFTVVQYTGWYSNVNANGHLVISNSGAERVMAGPPLAFFLALLGQWVRSSLNHCLPFSFIFLLFFSFFS